MATHRFAEQIQQASAAPTTGVPVGFALLPVFVMNVQQPFHPMQEIYRRAYEEALAKVRISRLEKRFFSVWN